MRIREKKDALAYIETLRASKRQPKFSTFSDLYELFQPELEKLSHSKKQAYTIAWKKISGEISFRSIQDMTVPMLQQIVDEHGTSYYTKRDIKNLLSHLYKIAIRDDIVNNNKAQYIRLPALESEERTTFTEDEIHALWLDADKYIVKHILVMIYTGMRPAELLGVRVENIHIDEHYMTGGVKTRKSKNRKIIIPDKITGIVSQLISTAESEKLSNYTRNQFYCQWNAYKSLNNMREELLPYCCRHTYVTRLTALKLSPAMLRELAGHEDYETTLEYTHLSVSDRLREVNRLE